jgi:hypothetical protein
MHDLVGNVAEYTFDGTPDNAPLPPNVKPVIANAVIKDAIPAVTDIDAALATQPLDARGKKLPNLFVIGGSSLSSPKMPFNLRQPLDLDLAASGFSDVGVRLAYTAPIDSIIDVLAATFKDPHYLPGTNAKALQ